MVKLKKLFKGKAPSTTTAIGPSVSSSSDQFASRSSHEDNDDDNDEKVGSDPLAGFSKRTAHNPFDDDRPYSARSSSNPFEDDVKQIGVRKNNPFEEDDDGEEEHSYKPQVTVKKTALSPKPMKNPFGGDDDEDDDHHGNNNSNNSKLGKPVNRATLTRKINPFEENEDDYSDNQNEKTKQIQHQKLPQHNTDIFAGARERNNPFATPSSTVKSAGAVSDYHPLNNSKNISSINSNKTNNIVRTDLFHKENDKMSNSSAITGSPAGLLSVPTSSNNNSNSNDTQRRPSTTGGSPEATSTMISPLVVPKPLIAKRSASTPHSRAESTAGAVPTTAARKRWGAFTSDRIINLSHGTSDTDSTRPILAGMDEDSVNTNNYNNAMHQSQPRNTVGTTTSSNTTGLASWLRLNKKEDDAIVGVDDTANKNSLLHSSTVLTSSTSGNSNNDNNIRSNDNNFRLSSKKSAAVTATGAAVTMARRKKCKAIVTPWPFDNFHQVQEQIIYEELASRAASDYTNGGKERAHLSAEGDPSTRDPQLRTTNSSSFQHYYLGRNGGAGGGDGVVPSRHAKYYEQPDELPSIKEAVNQLALIDFEKKAEERAIHIVSTWLFDAGLIDDLLVSVSASSMTPAPTTVTSSAMVFPSGDATVRSSEGIEVGSHGFPLLGTGPGGEVERKIDKETSKLRAMVQRDLSIINARLNDGVAASGLEVQELVNAVSTTKEDIGRLRELTTYISNNQISDRNEFLLAQYPYLRKAIHARRNIHRCFRELQFFSQIPCTCERLRDELHGGEWTEEEWSTIRNVAMEHVELEIMLVEAESNMKGGRNFNDDMVDRFLDSHVQNVWELGDEIRMRMLSGIGSAFELAINNPAGMVALVEAVEVYERAAESFEKKRHEERKKSKDTSSESTAKLRFTNMRAAALEQLYQDFELRGVEMFRSIHEQAADEAEEDDASNTQFTAVLKAATELVTEIDIVKHQMSPCFAPHWHVEALWSSCVAHVCSNHIVQQIGGPDGQNLPELTITQLLELVAWVEYFRETIEETFPEVAEMHDTKKTYFEERPDLFAGDKRTVNMRKATDSLAWVNNMLWEIHRLAQEEFLVRTRSQTDEWLDKVYGSETVKNQSSEGKLTTSLCEDVFSFSSVQLRTIRERLSKKSDALILAVCVVLSHMRSKQIHSRNIFLQDLETCCAASNDFTRMSEKCEDMMSELLSQCEFSEDMIVTLEASSNELMSVYSSDAVYSARSVHIYVFDPIEEEIGTRLFESAWEQDMVGNDLAISLVRTLEDFHEDLVHYMDDFMVVKSVMSLMSATVIFYVKCLLMRAEKHRNNKRHYFGDVKTALDRMTGDIKIMREYFEGLVPEMPALKKNIEKDFEILSTIHELLSIAAKLSVSEAEDFILVLQKRVRDVGITKHIVGDLWHLVAPADERYVWELVESMEEQLVAIAPADDALLQEVNDRSYVKGLRLDEMAVKLYVKSRRNRPIKATAVESIVKSWSKTWAERTEEGKDEE